MKRIGAVALAFLYALPATWALQGGIDLLRTPRVTATSDDRCAPHGCGCEESVKVRNACCCAPVAGAPAPSSALEASRCSGTEAAALTLLIPPVLPSDLLGDAPKVALPLEGLSPVDPVREPLAPPPDKVPIL